jgi:hypothetical protein
MSLEYYLFCRDKYCLILNYLNEIDNILDEKYDGSKGLYSDKFFLEKFKSDITKSKLITDKKIFQTCDHEFIDDMIDITPDKSLHIKYCKFCNFTKE